MKKILSHKIFSISVILLAVVCLFVYSTNKDQVDFSSQIKPIINKKCITCHGGVKNQAGFSLLFREEALVKTKSGKIAIVPGDADKSEMIRRLTLDDPEERMPYQHAPLSKDEIKLLTRWINQGAKWGEHWAYVPVKKQEIPSVSSLFGEDGDAWVKNDIDNFVFTRLKSIELKPSAPANPETILRRVALDITGIPANEKLAQTFLKNPDDASYERLVDSLLASPAYGERWTSMWMDLARYADSKGYEKDGNRIIWQYRDWLIKAFNDDKPYNQFLVEQLAGDLLPNATDDQLLATAYHRNTMTNDEGGTDNEEFRTAALLDRINTTWEALMGTSFGCAQCHSHPYDPFKHEDYYRFMAYFNNTRDEDTFDDYPLLRQFDEASLNKLEKLTSWLKVNATPEQTAKWLKFIKTWQPSINSLTADNLYISALTDTKWLVMRKGGTARFKSVDLSGKTELVFRYQNYVAGGEWTVRLDSTRGRILKKLSPGLTEDWKIESVNIPAVNGVHDLYFVYENRNMHDGNENGIMFDWLHFTEPFPAGKKDASAKEAYDMYWQLLNADVAGIPIMQDNPSDMFRETRVFERGNWLVKGVEVKPGLPASLNSFPSNLPANRLGLAKWMTSYDNPLTARTMVNRMWEQLYGKGLVETLEDLGSQGASPINQELLDDLAWKFMHDFNWSIKKLFKEIVMSATYRQDSKINKESMEKDPENKYYSRSPRIRLTGEQLRDQGLFISGLLSSKMYGPPVMPEQPDGIWLSPYNGDKWIRSKGEDAYRRAVYTYWKRTAPYPSMITFDGAPREVCTARRIRTNTPLQALVTMNDEAYLEMARNFAYNLQRIATNPRDQIIAGFRKALYKEPGTEALQSMQKLYDQALSTLQNDPVKTCEVVGVMDKHNNPETAALVIVTNAILNLDEIITRN
jgi:hypothetical protein